MPGSRACNFIKKGTLSQVFSCEFYEMSTNTFSYRISPVVTSVCNFYTVYKNNFRDPMTTFFAEFFKTSRTQPATLLKKRHWHRCFPVNFVKFLRIPFLQNTSGRRLREDCHLYSFF